MALVYLVPYMYLASFFFSINLSSGKEPHQVDNHSIAAVSLFVLFVTHEHCVFYLRQSSLRYHLHRHNTQLYIFLLIIIHLVALLFPSHS